MTYIYMFVCVVFSIFSHKYFKKWVNPITAFCLPWGFMVFFYNLKLVEYYDLSVETYFVILFSTVIFFITCLIGANCRSVKFVISRSACIQTDTDILERKMKSWIIILSTISLGVNVLRIIGLVGQYGWDFYNQLAKIYGEKLLGIYSNSAFEIPYSGFLIIVLVIFAGIYFSYWGFKKILFFPLFLLLIQPILGGTKQVLIEGAILICFSIFLALHRELKVNKPFFLLSILLILFMMFFVTGQRISYISEWNVQTYATSEFQIVIDKIPALYQIYTYFSSPVGVLNAYLNNPSYSFGGNTLLPLYNLLGHFDPALTGVRYQEFYDIPIHVNVGTMIREFIQDYHYLGASIFLTLFGLVSGNIYKRYLVKKDISSIYLNSISLMVIFMSFFVWMYRDANLWIAVFVGNWICHRIQKYP